MSNIHVPVIVAEPVRAPAVVSVKPGGNGPSDTSHVYGGVPPLALNVWEYVLNRGAGGSGDGLLIVSGGGGGFTVSENVLVAGGSGVVELSWT
jgi:hypothetical protein